MFDYEIEKYHFKNVELVGIICGDLHLGIPHVSSVEKTIQEIDTFMEQLFPIPDVRRTMWEHLASSLIGVNYEQTMFIYTGSGRNGKSLLVKLMTLCLGEYKASVPISYVTQKRKAIGGPTSEIACLQGVRYAVMQEPSKGDTFNEGIIKEITGESLEINW